jgi:hypothetical protein
MLGFSLRIDLYMTYENQVFVANVVVTDPTQKMVASNVISSLAGVVVKLNAIVKIRKCRRLRKGHHFIPMAIKVHSAPRHDMDRFIRECACIFHDK